MAVALSGQAPRSSADPPSAAGRSSRATGANPKRGNQSSAVSVSR